MTVGDTQHGTVFTLTRDTAVIIITGTVNSMGSVMSSCPHVRPHGNKTLSLHLGVSKYGEMVVMIAVQSIPRTLTGADSAAISAVNTCLAADTDTMGTDGTGDV